MQQKNFKKLIDNDGQEYTFDYQAFKKFFKIAVVHAKNNGSVKTVEEFEENFAESLAVSVSSIKQWKSGNNGVSDMDRIKEMAQKLGLSDYKKLLITEQREVSDMNKVIDEKEYDVAREVFGSIAEMIKQFKDTDGYSCYEEGPGIPAFETVIDTNDRTELIVMKSRFDIPKEVFIPLEQLYFEIASKQPEEIAGASSFERSMKVEELADEYYEQLCTIMERYLK